MAHLVVKWNSGNPAVICSKCYKILRSATSGECLDPTIYAAEYYDNCMNEIINEINKTK